MTEMIDDGGPNPYREHSEEMINKLENAGLGYHFKYDKTPDKLRKIPMRRLVYRVKEIPASMFPLIWDFGNLDTWLFLMLHLHP